MLIVSANGRSSATTHAKGQLFVATRVFEVYLGTRRVNLGCAPRDPFLHPTKGSTSNSLMEVITSSMKLETLMAEPGPPMNPHGNYRTDGQKMETVPR